jgi:hypothetical protein
LPTSADLDDPLGFVTGESKAEDSEASFDRALAELLDEADATPRGDSAPDDHDQRDEEQ